MFADDRRLCQMRVCGICGLFGPFLYSVGGYHGLSGNLVMYWKGVSESEMKSKTANQASKTNGEICS